MSYVHVHLISPWRMCDEADDLTRGGIADHRVPELARLQQQAVFINT